MGSTPKINHNLVRYNRRSNACGSIYRNQSIDNADLIERSHTSLILLPMAHPRIGIYI
jgi:hypothetical protein